MSRCILCDWGPGLRSVMFAQPKYPTKLTSHRGDKYCDVCIESVTNNLISISKKEKKDS